MRSKNHTSLVSFLGTVLLAASNIGCNGGQSTPPPPISVSVSPSTTQSVDEGQTASFTATVANDSSNKGVTWTVSCSPAPCGTVSPAATASGAATTYTAPSTVVAGNLNVTVTATSVADGSKSAPGSVTVMGLSVTVSPSTPQTVNLGQTLNVSATVANDALNKGVTWTVSCATAPCGTVSPVATASGAATKYTAPSTPPAGNLTVTLTATSVTDGTKTASATITIPGIMISIAPASASVPSGGTQQFTATVSGDPSNGGVTWSLETFSCNIEHGCTNGYPPHVSPCNSGCGSVSPANTASGAATTYTAPRTPPFPQSSFRGMWLVATSVTNTGASVIAPITALPISLSVSPTSTSVALTANQQFTATLTNDGTNSGVTWTLTQNGVACSPGCGTTAPAGTASGAAATYTAPGTAPVVPVVTVTATSVEDTTKSSAASIILTTSSGGLPCGAGSANESVLKGQYAFFLRDGQNSIGGSIEADGAGKIMVGEEDIERTDGTSDTGAIITSSGSLYAVGPDHRGCLLLTNTNGETNYFRFALGSINSSSIATSGQVLEFDDTTGTATRAAGMIRLQDPTSFAASQFKGNYAFGLIGWNGSWGRIALAGAYASDGVSTISSINYDLNVTGTVTSNGSATGTFTCCSSNGRGTLGIGSISTPVPLENFIVYMINSGDAFLLGSQWAASGEAIAIPSGTKFSQSSLNGAAILRETAQSSSGPVVDIATASADEKGAITTNDNVNDAGTFTTSSTALNYVVAPNGRVALSGGTTPAVLYLYGPNQGFLVGTDANVTFGILEPQAAGPFSNASFSGAYTLGTENPSASTVKMESGVVTADGKGNAAGTSDQSSSTGLAQNQSLNFSYSFPANGVGNVGSSTTAILISGSKLVFINNTGANPTITVVEK